MNEFPLANYGSGTRDLARSATAIVGMAALWISVFKQLLYPVLYAYYRTGDESALIAQGVFSVALVAASLCLLAAHARLGGLLGKGRWIVVALGIGGAAGIALRVFSDPTTDGGEIAMYIGALLSAAYVPVHLVFWALHVRRPDGADASRAVAASLALFLVAYGALALTGTDSAYVSVACPAVSAVTALACPDPGRGGSRDDGEPAIADATAMPASQPTPSKPAAHRSAISQPSPRQPAFSPTIPQPPPLPANAFAGALSSHPSQKPGPTPPPTHCGVVELPDGFAEAFGLSEREAELAAYAHRNWSARRIAGELFIAESTVYTHLKRIYRKTDVHSKSELIELIDSWR